MISANKLRELAIGRQTTELNIRREYVQHLFMSYFYQQPQASNIFFKGGTALRLIYGSPRFSEDLDFSTTTSDIKQIEDTLQESLREVEWEGVKTEIIESKATTGGYLRIIEFLLIEEKVSLQIEISLRDKEAKREVITIINDFIPPYTIMGLVKEQLVSQKIRALLKRGKPRDYYDLYFILRANLLSPQEKEILPKILKKLTESRLSWSRELEQFLPKSHWVLVRNFKSTLEREIQKFI